MKKFISIFAIAAVAALAFVSCNKEDKEDNVKGTWTLDCNVLNDTNLTEKEMDKLEDYIYDLIKVIVFEDFTLKEAVEEVNAMIWINGYGDEIAARYPDKYYTVQFGIVNDKGEWVKEIEFKCKDGELIN